MSAYENGLKSNDTRYLLKAGFQTSSKYFGKPSGKPAETPAKALEGAPAPTPWS